MYCKRLSVLSKMSLALRKRANWPLEGDRQAHGNSKKRSDISFQKYISRVS